ncbi:patatin-like phospholipase family protein [Pasteurella atlantica]|uniref:Patatin-like phospholipase family protein n=2 Tax=Pasteurellaceae TaxID=712 RepID=A0ACC6HL33_9PAST|nr:patatin-like phospholipase family protein [Pasteurella atlantica]MDP8032979.1 patatin-like phospholipase family protein [Pasteurella atlantica]MDP8034864.1 patatin-like phospholipase family protein [Pasteurella atlantica]MDP8036866.1 patatin-like phospholipase family protein [Pasteurella atlantica]MDP8047161.1 patatin-like phospholipase family protein [Pasteurella atlantica]MDP8049329.1 patatin-like phospholipase family protein [Pasteurella atlantica]
MIKRAIFLSIFMLSFLSACSSVKYHPVETINQINTNNGYRVYNVLSKNKQHKNLIILMFSGGGNRAASLGYGVLEQFAKTEINPTAKGRTLLDNIDLVYGVSGGSVLASYFALEGKNVIPQFEEQFLKYDFQQQIVNEALSVSTISRLTSPQFGRGDLLAEQLNSALFKDNTFDDLLHHRKGPFAVISATDMNMGQRLNFIQEDFDLLCLDLKKVKIARAVAASSAVPLIFSPLTFNNNGGSCYPSKKTSVIKATEAGKNKNEIQTKKDLYKNSQKRPFIHLVDGGLTDNLGLRSLLDTYNLWGFQGIKNNLKKSNIKNVIVINVNAQNQITSNVDLSADIPNTSDIVNAIINVPIDSNTQNTLNSFRALVDEWNKKQQNIKIYFVSLNLKDLPTSSLRDEVLNIDTSFYLPKEDVNKLKQSAKILLDQSVDYQEVLKVLR